MTRVATFSLGSLFLLILMAVVSLDAYTAATLRSQSRHAAFVDHQRSPGENSADPCSEHVGACFARRKPRG
jgi:hypothetical protein